MESFKIISRSKELGSTKSLLKKGLVPGIIYGKNTDSTKIAFENKILKKLMEKGGFYSKIIDLDIDGKIEKVLPKQLQYHPVTDKLIHFDFLRVQDDTKVNVEVAVDFLNKETVKFDDVSTKVRATAITSAISTFTVTANAEHIPKTCLVIGLSSIRGSVKYLFAM